METNGYNYEQGHKKLCFFPELCETLNVKIWEVLSEYLLNDAWLVCIKQYLSGTTTTL